MVLGTYHIPQMENYVTKCITRGVKECPSFGLQRSWKRRLNSDFCPEGQNPLPGHGMEYDPKYPVSFRNSLDRTI